MSSSAGCRGRWPARPTPPSPTPCGAGGRRADEVVKELLRLVTVDEQGRPTRWRVRRDELPDTAAAELDAFVARRLLTTDSNGGGVVIGVAHEAFLSAWPPLAEAITEASTALRARRGIEQAAADWADSGRPAERLWERGQLAAALADTGAREERESPDADRDRPGGADRAGPGVPAPQHPPRPPPAAAGHHDPVGAAGS